MHANKAVQIKLLDDPIIQGWHDTKGLWRLPTVSTTEVNRENATNNEVLANIYGLPSIPQVIKYLHAMASFLTKDTWMKSIKAGNYIS